MSYCAYSILLIVLLLILLTLWTEEVRARKSVTHGLANKYWILRERRRFVRFNKEMRVRYSFIGAQENNHHETKTTNISRKGLCISSYTKLKEKDLVSLEIEVPGFSKAVKATGEVMWIKELHSKDGEGHRMFYAGIRFSKIDPESEAALLTHLNTLTPFRQ
ncbi:MAG: PilZ domain-containing protein [Candidatus Omnitrophota bacterium]